MRLEEWRGTDAAVVERLYDRERQRWCRDLHWDVGPSLAIVEASRRAGQLPGFVAYDELGALLGWTYFVVRNRTLQIGALTGHRADAVRGLIDAVLEAPEVSLARRYQCFVYPESSVVAVALERRRFAIERYRYLERSLDRVATAAPVASSAEGSGPHRPSDLRRWTEDDLPAAVRVMARAYAGSASARCFAPTGRLDEWTSYVLQLLRTPACGHLAEAESWSLGPAGVPRGFLLATRVHPETTHVAQVVVDPATRRHGGATALVEASATEAARAGATRQTLLVAETNEPAAALYARLGFSDRASFLFADRERITRGRI
jgi:ribosomal protein S18 acetylase RimI-like enzyme